VCLCACLCACACACVCAAARVELKRWYQPANCKSQPAKLVKRTHNVHCFFQQLLFQLVQQPEVPSTCVLRNVPCLVLDSINTFLTCTWLQTGQQHTSFCPQSSPHLEENLCAINRSFSGFMWTTVGMFWTDIPASHLYSPRAFPGPNHDCSIILSSVRPSWMCWWMTEPDC
jgi:hypothetical protein